MTSNRHPHITLIQPSELLASVPHLLGFHPADSLVVVGLQGSSEATISVVLRSDLPPPSDVRALAEYLLVPLTQHGSTAAVMIVVGGVEEAPADDLPHQELLARCESVLIGGGFPVVHQLWTPDTAGGRRWHCYDEFDCTGIVPDPANSKLAATAAEAGMITYDRREDMVATLEPEPDEVLARRSASLDLLADKAEPDTTEPDDSTRTRLHVVQSAIDAVGATAPTLSDNDVIQLSAALADHRIRDTCLDFDELPDVAAAERLWTALARATPAPERAEPACLLAFSAYARGDGVLAGIALAQAEAADPGHRLSSLLRSALALGLPPRKIRIAGIRAATFARKALTDNQPPTPTEPAPTQPETPAATLTPETTSTTADGPSRAQPPETTLMPTNTTQTAPDQTETSTSPAVVSAAEVASATADAPTVPTLTEPQLSAPAEAASMPADTTAPALAEPPAVEAIVTATTTTVATASSGPPADELAATALPPAAEAIVAVAPAEMTTTSASAWTSTTDPTATTPIPAGPPTAETIGAAAATTPAATPSVPTCVPVATEPVLTELPAAEAVVAVAPAEMASDPSAPVCLPATGPTSAAPVAVEPQAEETIAAAATPTMAATSPEPAEPLTAEATPIAAPTEAVSDSSAPVCVPATGLASAALVAVEPPAAKAVADPAIGAISESAGPLATEAIPAAAPTEMPASVSIPAGTPISPGDQTAAASPPDAVQAVPAAMPAGTAVPPSVPASTPAGEAPAPSASTEVAAATAAAPLPTTGAPTATPTEAATPTATWPDAIPTNERLTAPTTKGEPS
jgi:hypothetical protein